MEDGADTMADLWGVNDAIGDEVMSLGNSDISANRTSSPTKAACTGMVMLSQFSTGVMRHKANNGIVYAIEA